jgi:hypothetical protein
MALVGKLEDLQLAELFHLLSLFKKTGKLTLNADDSTGAFYFKQGKIYHASNGKPGPVLGELLVRRHLLSQPELDRALRIQGEGPDWRRLGAILIEQGLVNADDLDALLREQLQEVVGEFISLEKGFFSFKPSEIVMPAPEMERTNDLDIDGGINTDGFILDLLTRLDEVQRSRVEGIVAPVLRSPDSQLAPPAATDLASLLDYMIDGSALGGMEDGGPARFEAPDELGDLCSLMTEIQLRTPSYTGEIALMILRYASSLVNRGLLFHVGSDGITGIGQFGLGAKGDASPGVDAKIRSFFVPNGEPSVFLDVAEIMQTYRGPLKRCRWNSELIKLLGGPVPNEVVAIPIVVDGMIAAVFYGDNVPEGEPIGSIKGLELLMIEAGLAMERRLLQAKLQRVEGRLQSLDRAADREVVE